jgi:hypothetical protein
MIPLVGEEYRDEETGAIMPETVSKHAKEAAEKYPNKRLIVHYMQPHTPYIGPTGREHFDGFRTRSDFVQQNDDSNCFDVGKLRTAYRENLKIILHEITELLDVLDGKTVISADHGEMLGERHFPIPMRDYMHPHGIDNKELVKIPWLAYTDGSRKSIVAEQPDKNNRSIDTDAIEEQLKELGYLR